MNDPTFIFSFGIIVTALIMIPLGYAIVTKNRINRRQQAIAERRASD